MAKQKQPAKPTARPPGTVAVRLDLTAEQRARLREAAGKVDASMSELARRAVLEKISEILSRNA